ncbi:MAG TPA: NERD domain-containing protein [Anaerolineales bacterium]|nr:NERD domain-containing protein [Anaerolineales bacterium]
MPLNVINFAPLVESDGTVTLINRVLGTLQFGRAWYKEIQAQEIVISRLRKLLSDRFTLIRNFTLPDEEISIPILLISGAGIWIITVTDATGIFKTQGKELLEMDNRTQEFAPAQVNLVMRTLLLSRVFEEFLQKHKIPVPPIEPVLIFTDPGVDVTTGDGNIRVLLSDALNRFVTGLLTTPARTEPGTSKRIVDLINETQKKSKEEPEKSGGFKLNFTTTQWIVIGALVVILALSVMLLIALLLST